MKSANLLASKGFIQLNIHLIQTVGLHEAIIIGELLSEYNYWEQHGKLDNGWFYSTVENIQKRTSLSRYQQAKAIEHLEELGVLKTTLRGVPARRYIKIDDDKLLELFS